MVLIHRGMGGQVVKLIDGFAMWSHQDNGRERGSGDFGGREEG